MKKLITLIVALSSVIASNAGTTILGGTGVNINANSTSNLTAIATVGTLSLTPQTLTQSYSNSTNAGSITVYARLTFDGTNFYTVPTYWTNSTTGGTNSAVWRMASANYTVYGSLSISNAMGQVLTNYAAVLSN
ncbi:MAG TPA: hypothetical protein VE843_02005 [Ktedonobacteraceae bacterium]|nr:hypothetical protein [Ktedonobacteraceae bacterium]